MNDQDRCEYCYEDCDGYIKPMDKNGHVYIWRSLGRYELNIKANRWKTLIEIKHCPMCGRRLT